MTVYFLSMATVLGGAERVGLDIATSLRQCFQAECVLNANQRSRADFSGLEAAWIKVPGSMVKIARNPLAFAYFFLASIWFLVRRWPKSGAVYYCNDLESVVLAAACAVFRRGRVIWHIHDVYRTERFTTRLMLFFVARVACAVVCITSRNAQRLRGTLDCPIYVIPNSCRLEPRRKPRKREFRDGGEIILGYLGQITSWKRVDIAIALVAELNRQGIKSRLIVAGTPLYPSDREYAEQLRRSSSLDETVTWLGHVDDVEAYFDRIDFLLTLSSNEPFGLVLLEAMSQGVPVIASSGDGPDEVLRNGGGYIVQLGEEIAAVPPFLKRLTSLEHESMSFQARNIVSMVYQRSQFECKLCDVVSQVNAHGVPSASV